MFNILPNKNPTLTFPSNEKYGFTVELLYYEPEKETLNAFSMQMTETFAEKLKEKIISDIPTLLSFANFLGEAETYMSQNNIRYSKKIRDEYAKAIYNDFINSLEKSIFYNKEENCIYISPYVFSLEFGDFYRPAIQFITHNLIDWIKELEESIKAN